jgi:hypothetical protein
VLQWLSPAGGGSRVLAMTRWMVASSTVRGRPERGWSRSPARPSRAKRARQRPTMSSEAPSSPAIWRLLAPAAARSTMRARVAVCWGVEGVRANRRSSASSSGESSIAAAARAMWAS